jgi:hypothetical protein
MANAAGATVKLYSLNVMATVTTLEQIFGAFVAQGTLEEAADMMAGLAESYPELRGEFAEVLRSGAAAARKGDTSIVDAVNFSGYRAIDSSDAAKYCEDLLTLYWEQVNG